MERITENIYRLTVPFKDIYTTVLFIKTDDGYILFDTACCDEDAEKYILPAAAELDGRIEGIFLSHDHADHAGGLSRILQEYPNASVFTRSDKLKERFSGCNLKSPSEGSALAAGLYVVEIPGHTADSMGIFDGRTDTLLTGDCLQLYGIYGSGVWGSNIRYIDEHKLALAKLRLMNPGEVVAAHDYHPLGWRGSTKAFIDECESALYNIERYCNTHAGLDSETLAERYKRELGLPAVGKRIFDAMREYILSKS